MRNRLHDAITRLWWGPVAVLFLAQFLSGVIASPQHSLLPVYMERDLFYGAMLISLLSSARQVLGMVASIVGGTLCDRIGRRMTFLLGLSGIIAGSVLFLLKSPFLFVVVYAYVGFSLGLRTVGGQGYLIDAARPESLGVLSAYYTWGMTLGGALGNLIAGPIVDRTSFAYFGWLALAVSSVLVLGVGSLLPRIQSAEPQAPAAGEEKPRRGLGYGELIREPRILVLGALRFLPTCYWGVAGIFIPLWLYRTTQSVAMVAWYGTISQVVASLAQWLVGTVSDRIGRRTPTLIALGTLVVAISGIALTGHMAWGLYVFGTLAASAAWSMSALMPGLVSDAASSDQRGRTLGFLHLLWNTGMLVGSLMGGALFETNPALPFGVAGALNLVALALGFQLFRFPRRQAQTAE